MIKSKREMLLIGVIGFLSSAVSYVFTILMLMSFAETNLEKFLYFLCGVIIDGVKWFSLITMIKYYRAKLYNNVFVYCVLFILFFGMSVTASVSYSIYTVKKQMYKVEYLENTAYTNGVEQTEKLKNDITAIEVEKGSELGRLNSELDGLPLDYITRRRELSDKKIELTNFYDNKIGELKAEYDTKATALNEIDNTPQEVRTLKVGAITGFFETISNVTKASMDNIILIFAVALGVILDVGSIALTFDKAFSYKSKRGFNKDMTTYKNIRLINHKLKHMDDDRDEDNDVEDKPEHSEKILNYSGFVNFVQRNHLDIDQLTYNDMKEYMPKSSFYKFKEKYKNEYIDYDMEA